MLRNSMNNNHKMHEVTSRYFSLPLMAYLCLLLIHIWMGQHNQQNLILLFTVFFRWYKSFRVLGSMAQSMQSLSGIWNSRVFPLRLLLISKRCRTIYQGCDEIHKKHPENLSPRYKVLLYFTTGWMTIITSIQACIIMITYNPGPYEIEISFI